MRISGFVICLALATPAIASPPPPPPEYIVTLAKELAAPMTPDRLGTIAPSIAVDVTVSVNGRRTVDGKANWLAAERKRIGKVDRRVIAFSPGYDSLMVVDQIDDRSGLADDPHILADARNVTRAIQYRFGADHLIHEILVLQGGVYVSTLGR